MLGASGQAALMSETGSFGDSVYQSGDPVDDTDDLDPVEALTGDDPDEVMQTSYDPPDREPYNFSRIPTPEEEREGESLDQKLSEEEPEVSEADIDEADVEPRAGRLLAPNEGVGPDYEKDEIAEDVGPAGYASSAEEAAVHVIDEE
jgi:Family of unknown function (DUF5709)